MIATSLRINLPRLESPRFNFRPITDKQKLELAARRSIKWKDYREAPAWLHDGQRGPWNSLALDTVACAGTQGGKTAIESPWLLKEIQRCAPLIKSLGSGKFIYAGPTITLLEAQAIPSFKEVFVEQEQLGRYIGGSKPKFVFSKNGLMKTLGFDDCPVTVLFAYTNDSSNLESMTALAGVWDEAGQKENRQESYGAYNRRLKVGRSATFESVLKFAPQWWINTYYADEGPSATFGRRLWGTTPYEWNWFKNDIYNKAEKCLDGFELFNWDSWLSPRISYAECLLEQARMPTWKWEMMYRGKYTKPAGVIYDTFDYARDTEDDFPIPSHWPIYPGVDFGDVNMGAVLVAEDPETQVLYVIREYLQGSRTFKEHADAIKQGYAVRGGAGGSHQEGGWREAFRSNGLPLDEPPINDVNVGIGCVYAQVKTHNLIFFRNACQQTISDMQTYSRPVAPDGEPVEGIDKKSKFHRLDAVRYIVTKLRPNHASVHTAKATARQAPGLASAEPTVIALVETNDGDFVPLPGSAVRRR